MTRPIITLLPVSDCFSFFLHLIKSLVSGWKENVNKCHYINKLKQIHISITMNTVDDDL